MRVPQTHYRRQVRAKHPNAGDLPLFLTPQEAALMLNVTERTLINWRAAHRGPVHYRVGTTVRYLRADVVKAGGRVRPKFVTLPLF